AVEIERREAPGTRLGTSRVISVRRTSRPIALIPSRKVAQRAISSGGVAALSVSDGITNCGSGPSFGPIANRKAPLTGCPSAEMTRQYTRYQPSGRFGLSGVTSVSGSVGERWDCALASWFADGSVTDTVAKR